MEEKRKKIGKWINGTENSPEIDSHTHGQLIFDKGANKKEQSFQSLMLKQLDTKMQEQQQQIQTIPCSTCADIPHNRL